MVIRLNPNQTALTFLGANHLLRKINRFVDLSRVGRIWGPTIATWSGPRLIQS